jgi:carbon storage regulator
MLVLSRRSKEQVLFPTLGVRLTVVEVKGQSVRLGIEAPPEVPIIRAELLPPLRNKATSRPRDLCLCHS